MPFSKGGDYCKYYYDVDLIIDWSSEAQGLHATMGNGLPNSQHYFRKGLTYPRVTVKGFNVRFLPPDCVFADKGPLIFTPNDEESALFYTLAYLNTSLVQAILLMLTPSRSFEVGQTFAPISGAVSHCSASRSARAKVRSTPRVRRKPSRFVHLV